MHLCLVVRYCTAGHPHAPQPVGRAPLRAGIRLCVPRFQRLPRVYGLQVSSSLPVLPGGLLAQSVILSGLPRRGDKHQSATTGNRPHSGNTQERGNRRGSAKAAPPSPAQTSEHVRTLRVLQNAVRHPNTPRTGYRRHPSTARAGPPRRRHGGRWKQGAEQGRGRESRGREGGGGRRPAVGRRDAGRPARGFAP